MLYSEFINKAEELTIEQAENGLFYLEPMWRNILFENKLNLKSITNAKTDWNDIASILKLEVEKRNTINSKKPDIIDWLYELIMAQVEPAILSEETNYIKAVTDYIKTSHEQQELKEEQA